MSTQHKNLSAGAWARLSLVEQMAHIGSEVERALNWQIKRNEEYTQKALDRAFDLIDLTLESDKNSAHLREVARMREAVVDYFFGENEYKSSENSWRRYFLAFNYSARKDR